VTVSGPSGELVAAGPAAGPVPAVPAAVGAAGVGAAGSGAASIPLQAYGLTVGSLGYRAPDRPLSDAEQRLVRDLARQLGGARHCDVSLACIPAGLAVTISDDGAGFGPPGHHGHGLAIMRERADELGGEVTVTGTMPGVTVEARLPVTGDASAVLPVPA